MKKLNSQENLEQIPLLLNKPTKSELKNGIIGNNHEALEALKSFIYSEYIQIKSFLLWGNQGSGKSFWLLGPMNTYTFRVLGPFGSCRMGRFPLPIYTLEPSQHRVANDQKGRRPHPMPPPRLPFWSWTARYWPGSNV